jgi:hypothetical protein
MKTQLQTALTAYAAFLKAGTSYGTAMQALAKSLGGTPCATTLAEFAKLHAEKYKCNFTWDGKGRAVFFDGDESTRESRNNAARMSWQRNVMVWFTPEKPKAPKAHARITPDARKAAKAYLEQFDTLAQAIAALRAVAK